ncbi:MAG: ABC transporter substrate-binding protein [Acidobacteria bacterium]|nr:ABC transporter substrate-binding protein [Acidobacteriota bacterium]
MGAVLSLSGEGSYYGLAIRQGMDLAAGEVNRSGGIGGIPLKILYRDSASSPEQAALAAIQLYDRQDVPMILGAVLSSETLRIAPLAEQRHKILLSPASSSPEITRAGKFIFRVYPSDTLEGAYMAQLAADELHLKRILVLAIDNAFGRGLASVFSKAFHSATPVEVQSYPAHGTDFAALAEQAREWGPDGIYLAGYYNDMAQALKEIRRLDPNVTILSTSSFGNPKTLEAAGEAAEGVIFPAIVFNPESDDPTVARFVKAFRNRYGSDPDLWAAHGYDAVLIAAEAMRNASGAAPERIAQALLSIRDFPGASGSLGFDTEGDVVQYPRAYIVEEGHFILYRDYLEQRRRQGEAPSKVRP